MISEILVAPQPVAWLPWAVQYFFYIGSAYGAALLLWLALRRRDSYSVTFIRAMALVLLISCVVGPLALTADLHQPGRAWHFFAYLTPGSWMSRGALLLPLFSLLGVVTGWLCLRPALQEAARTRWSPLLILLAAGRWSAAPALVRLCALLTVLSGASIALYTGSEVGIVAARPLWHQWMLPWLWLCSAPLASVGLWALVRGLLDQPVTATDRRLLRAVICSAALASLLLLACWLFWPSGRVGAEGLSFMRAQAWPAALLLLLTLAASRWLAQRRWPVALLAIGAAASLRWLTLIDVQRVPRYDAGIYPYTLAIGSEGWLGILAMAGLWVCLAAILTELIEARADAVEQQNG
ncbi:NrfD/PsrC family molybdoenzyme membrane anchor subunit [Edwardsiella piscicida]|uniref:NrfD/PsrC family molybdoenzyme membrane anchor subunit n=1 Tax=Edwardsiella piscicida TaxID=1263550 RepID=UPI0009330B0F|nr:NrfD/PsrC family molybdoenzyme membrane anchor subunit [Edwardsiella piscicida]EKS7811628.1 polysulfide reductase NrfD [Edwardsiella piscicida]UCQ22586.1 polysulfide reductase NrfD [Edwardsiella piscicida]WAM46214.1 polysulfide reductase NrfD [Edwardsiella piscicida]